MIAGDVAAAREPASSQSPLPGVRADRAGPESAWDSLSRSRPIGQKPPGRAAS